MATRDPNEAMQAMNNVPSMPSSPQEIWATVRGRFAGRRRRSFCVELFALPLVLTSAAAWGQSEEEVKAAMGKDVGAYANCLRSNVEASAKGSGTPEAAADHAFAACYEKQQGLWEKLQEPPLNDSADQATAEVQQMLDTLRPQMIEHFKKTKAGG